MAVASSSISRSAPLRSLLTSAQVGELLGYTPRQIRALAAAGELRRVVLGHRSTRYLAEDVEAYIERHTRPFNDLDPAGNRAEGKTSDDALTTQPT